MLGHFKQNISQAQILKVYRKDDRPRSELSVYLRADPRICTSGPSIWDACVPVVVADYGITTGKEVVCSAVVGAGIALGTGEWRIWEEID